MASLLALLGGIGVAVLMMVTLVAVIWRYVINDPIFGVSDLSVLTLTVVAAGAVALGAGSGSHVSVNLIGRFFGRGVTRVTDALMRLLSSGICALAAYALVDKACGIEKACITDNLSLAHRPYYYILAWAMAVMALHYLVQMLVGLSNWHGADPNEIPD